MKSRMDKITVTYDRIGNTLDVWFGEPREAICEEIGNGVIIKKSETGAIIGFEKLNYVHATELSDRTITSLPVEVVVV
jgi:hypothetical protein